jgi:DNA polymerase III subunit delta
MPLVHAYDFLMSPPKDFPPVVIIFGGDTGLRGWVLSLLNQGEDITTVDGETARWVDMRDDLSTGSLFSMGERRTVIVRDGDKLVKDYRAEIETYVASPGDTSRLILELETLPSNTRLYKSATQAQLLVQCVAPQTGTGRVTRTDLLKIRPFIINYLAPKHQTKLTTGAADTLVDMIGDSAAMLDTEIAKLAVHLPVGGTINETLVRDVVEGWRGKTIWETTDAAAAGNAAEALKQLDKLMSGGERAIALLPQLSWSLRRLGLAMAVIEEKETAGVRCSPRDGLAASGFKGGPQDFGKAEMQLKQLGRKRAQRLLGWLLESDLRLKGSHSTEGRDRWAMEELILKMSKSS